MSTTEEAGATARVAVWDLPTRIFHWALAALFAFSWWSGKTERIDLHIWSGAAILTALTFRLLWGLVGGSTARFRNFAAGPRRLLRHLAGHGNWTSIGHTPLGALSVVVMLVLLVVQVGLGLISTDQDGIFSGPLASLVSSDASDAARDAHEALFNVVLGFVALHIGAVAYFRLVKRKRLVRAMISGSGDYPPGTAPLRFAPPWRAFLCLAAALAITRWIIAGAPPFAT